MSQTDPVSDMLTRIRNANTRRSDKTVLGHSRLKESLCKVLQEEGFIKDYKVVDDPKHGAKRREIHVYMKYGADRERIIRGMERVSKPGRRIFVGKSEVPKVFDGFGIAILSTSQGVVSSRRARALKSGGELICKVW